MPHVGKEDIMAEVLTTAQVKERIDGGGDFTLVETLLPREYAEGHLPGAINIHFKKIAEEAEKRFSKDDEIILYCHDAECNASPLAAKKLESLGYTNVKHYEGGKSAWKDAGYPMVS